MREAALMFAVISVLLWARYEGELIERERLRKQWLAVFSSENLDAMVVAMTRLVEAFKISLVQMSEGLTKAIKRWNEEIEKAQHGKQN